MTSRVVPACGETIATSRRASSFISVDLPTFGGPAIATTSPSRSRSLRPCAASTSSISPSSASIFASAGAISSAGTSPSSEKSMPASISADASMIRARQSRARSPSRPFSWRSAWRRCRSVSAWIRSSRPSASVRSSFPFSNARRVNSPGSAARTSSNRRERRKQRRQHRAAAMDVKLRDVLAGRAGRPGNHNTSRVVDRLLSGVPQQARACQPRRRHLPGQRGQRGAGLRPRYPYDRNRARRPARRQGENGLLTWMHRLFVSEPLRTQRNFGSCPSRTGSSPSGATNAAALLQHFFNSFCCGDCVQTAGLRQQ